MADIPGLPLTSLSINMLNCQVIGVSLLLVLFPSSSRIFAFLLLLVRVLFLFTSFEHSFQISRLLTNFSVITFASTSVLVTLHFGLWIFKFALFWVGNYIDRNAPSFCPWLLAIQFSGLLVMICPRLPLVRIFIISLTNSWDLETDLAIPRMQKRESN